MILYNHRHMIRHVSTQIKTFPTKKNIFSVIFPITTRKFQLSSPRDPNYPISPDFLKKSRKIENFQNFLIIINKILWHLRAYFSRFRHILKVKASKTCTCLHKKGERDVKILASSTQKFVLGHFLRFSKKWKFLQKSRKLIFVPSLVPWPAKI